MFTFFDLNIIPTFLSRFKVEKILAIGLSNNLIINEVISFCIDNSSLLYAIDTEIGIEDLIKENSNLNNIEEYMHKNVKYFKNTGLNMLPTLKSFDAIFINDDPNWYTLYNELNLIKKNNSDFPLVFVCNNKYPHKRRDSYINPENIPSEYKNECCNGLPVEYEENNEIKSTIIQDGYCHSIYKNTPKNGVLTAIEDFLKENENLKFLEINPFEGISLIYPNSTISYIRINQILEKKIESQYTMGDMSDKIIENDFLLKNLTKIKLIKKDVDRLEDYKSEINEKNKQIKDYKYEIELNNTQIEYKNSQIDNVKSQVSLKEAELQSIEAKLINKNNELESAENRLVDLEHNFTNNKKELDNVKKQLSEADNKNKKQKIIENKYKELIKINNEEIETKKNELENVKKQLSEADNKNKKQKIIENKYKELIKINNNEIETKKNQLKINRRELKNKNNDLITKETEIKTQNIKLDALKLEYAKQSRKLDTNEYCIHCYKEKIKNNDLEIQYLQKSNNFIKKIMNPFAYALIIFKSKSKEIGINIKLYKALKDSNCFDIGHYLNKNVDVRKSKWCKYFSPELHYVCEGFDENREFNNKYKNKSKIEIIEDVKNH